MSMKLHMLRVHFLKSGLPNSLCFHSECIRNLEDLINNALMKGGEGIDQSNGDE